MLPVEVLIQIFSYLRHKDLLEVRLVCKKWKMANLLSRFPMRTKIILSELNFKNFIEYLRTNALIFRIYHLELACEYSDCNQNDLDFVMSIIGPNVQSLLLPIELAYTNLFKNLYNTSNLRLSSGISIDNIEQQNICNTFNCAMLPKLSSIELKCHNYWDGWRYMKILENLNNLKLHHFSINFANEENEMTLLHILKTNASTLKSLDLTFVAKPLKDLYLTWGEVFKDLFQLNSLQLSGKLSFEWLCTIFDSLPGDANLTHIDLNGVLQVNGTLLAKIVRKWFNTLQQLEFMFCIRIAADGKLNALNKTNNLKILNLAHCSLITAKDLLEAINQENRTLMELNLTDLQQLDEECICTLAQRLPHIEVLNLENVRAVTDKVLAYIFHFQQRLLCLVLDGCRHITDNGLLVSSVFEDTINSLTKLQILSLRSCQNLTNRCLRNFRFKNFLCLKMCYCHRISGDGLRILSLNCPSLETLYISSCPKLNDESILAVCQNFRHLNCLNISNCNRLTELTVDYVVNHCQSLKELIMCGLISLDPNYINRKLQLKPKIKLVNT